MSSNPPRWEPPAPPPGGEPPSPPGYEPLAHQQDAGAAPQPRRQRSGLTGWLITGALLVAGWIKYAFLLLKAVPAFLTLSTLLLSFVLYAKFYGGFAVAAGLVLMILLHELGHVFEIRRQGMKATAPIFIPFLGAAIFQREHATDPIKQAQIGIAGPIAGTVAATAAFVLYGATHWDVLLFWAWIGFYINLFNLIPFGMLDGGWILAPVSKWFQVFGLVVLGALVLVAHLNPFLLIFVVVGLVMMYQRFRNPALDAYYARVPQAARLGMGVAWLALVIYLSFASLEAHRLLGGIVG